MHYVYILWSSKSKIFYTGETSNLIERLSQHNNGLSPATKPHIPWDLVYYCAFKERKIALDFERYLKTGSGKAFMYKRLVNGALKKEKLLGVRYSESFRSEA